MTDLSNQEKKISLLAVWIWRNILASGVMLACFGILYKKCEDIEDNLIEVRTIVRERIKIERGDYGWQSAAIDDKELTEADYKKGEQVRATINNFANGEKNADNL